MPEALYILLHCGILKHPAVHGRADQDLGCGRQHHGGKKIITNTVGHLANEIGRGRGDDNEIRLLPPGYVIHGRRRLVEHIPDHPVPGQGFECEGRDKPCGILRHGYPGTRSRLYQHANQLRCLVASDAPGHTHNDIFVFHLTNIMSQILL